MNSKLDIFIRLSCNIVLAFDLQVSRINAKPFKDYRLHMMWVEWDLNNKPRTSIPPFVSSYIAWTLGFFLWLLVTFTLSYIEDNTITFFDPVSFYRCKKLALSSPWSEKRIWQIFFFLFFQFATDFRSFCILLRSCRIVPMIVMVFSKAQDSKETNVKYWFTKMLIPYILQFAKQ